MMGDRKIIGMFSSIRPRILGRIAWLFVVLLNRSVRVRTVSKESPDHLASTGGKIIHAFFHGDMVPLLHMYRNSGLLIPVSESRDGEIMARLGLNCGMRFETPSRRTAAATRRLKRPLSPLF